MFAPRCVLLLLWVLLPLTGLAQAPEPESAAAQATPPPPLVPAPEEPETQEEPTTAEPPRGELFPRPLPDTTDPSARRSSRVPLKVLGASAGVAAGMLLTVGIFSLDPQDCDGFFCDPGLFFLGMGVGAVGITLGPALAVWGIGESMEDGGRFWPTLGGAALGTLGTLLTLVALANQAPLSFSVPLSGIWPALGSVLLYELTRRGPLPSELTASGMQLLPVVGMSPGGGLVGGLMGRF